VSFQPGSFSGFEGEFIAASFIVIAGLQALRFLRSHITSAPGLVKKIRDGFVYKKTRRAKAAGSCL
jgi:hypothetical protein